MSHPQPHSYHHLKRSLSVRLLRWLRGHPILRSEGLLLIAIVISLVCGSAAVVLHRAIEMVARLLHTGGEGLDGPWRPAIVVLTPAVGGLCAGLLLRYLVPEARGSGIPQVKLDLVMRRGAIPFKVALGKLVTTAIAVGSGGSVGREGPTVQMCASLGSCIAGWFPITAGQLRTMVHAACVSGVAAAFNTPIAGMTFVMEEIIGDLNARHLSYLIFAAVGAAMISRYFLGDEPVFHVPEYALGHPTELAMYVVIGVLSGLVAVAFIRLLVWSIGRFQSWRVPEHLKPAVGGLLVGTIALYLPQVLGGGYDIVTDTLQNRLPWELMALLIVAKFVTTILSYSSGTAGGLFAPSLFIGAMLGGSLAGVVDATTTGTLLAPGAFALVGMGATFAGIIRTPLTSILIIFEMTNDYALILPLMLANMTSFALARLLEPLNVYEAILAANEIHLPSAHDYVALEEMTASEAMVRHPVTVLPAMPISEVAALMHRYPYRGFPVTTEDHQLIGMVTITDLHRAEGKVADDAPVFAIATREHLVSAYPDHTLNWVMQQMGERDISIVPVVNRGTPPRLVGVLTMSDIVSTFAHSKEQHSSSKEQHSPSKEPY
jgi:CIC family chloride channel protein